jgi:hypothetical protein
MAADRANMRKLNARAAADKDFRARKYRPTARRVAASRASIKIAQATPRTPESWDPSRYNALKHGLYVHSFEQTLAKLGESAEEFRSFRERLERAFQARGAPEQWAAKRLAEALWRRLRLFKAQLRSETDALNRIFDFGAAAPSRNPEHLRTLGLLVMQALLNRPGLAQTEDRLLCMVERQIRAFLQLVVGGDPKFKIFTREVRRRMNIEKRLEQEIEQNRRLIELDERLRAGDPVAPQVLEEAVAELEKARVPLDAILRW